MADPSRISTLVLILIFILPSSLISIAHGSQPFRFIQPLVGSHKGQNVQGIHCLKQYLERFGYLHYNIRATHANDDVFDDILESAVRKYQRNYHLTPTGVLDAQTVTQMMQPRCGVVDIINGATRMSSGSRKNTHHHHHGPLSLHIVSHYSFFPGNPRWPDTKTNLTYKFGWGVQVVDLSTLRRLVSRAFAKWADVTDFTFTEVSRFSRSDLDIGFFRLNHGDGAPFDGNGGILAHAFAPTTGLFHYDADENWSTDPQMDEFDLESVALHEIGHLLGLGHSDVPGAIMFPSFSPGEQKRNLHPDDIAGIRDLYSS